MSRGMAVKIESSILAWARDAIGYSLEDAADKTKLDQNNIAKWEKENSDISLVDIKKFAAAYKRPVSFFFLPSPPKEKPIPEDFRTLDSARIDEVPQKIRLAIRRAQANRRTINDFFPDEYGPKIERRISLKEEPKDVAQIFRNFFDFSVSQQFALSDEKEALTFWIEAVEEKGIPVFQMDLNRDKKKKIGNMGNFSDGDFRGFCLREDSLPFVVVINSKDSRAGKIFTLIHELCHLFIGQDEIDYIRNQRGEAVAHKIVEAFANEFAGSFLVPYTNFQEESSFGEYKNTKDDSLVTKLARKFKVSELVIIRRFEVLGILTRVEYEAKKKVLEAKFEQIKILEREKLKAKLEENPNFFIPKNVPKETIQKVGYSLGSKAFQAVSEGRMTTFDLVQFLDIKIRHLKSIQGLIEKKYSSIV